MRRSEDTTRLWLKIKSVSTHTDLKQSEMVQSVLIWLANKFAEESLSTKTKQSLLNQLEPLIDEGIDILNTALPNGTAPARGRVSTEYLDRVQTILHSRP